MTPMQHTLSHAAMPKRSRQQPRPSTDLTVRRRTATRDSVRRESSASTLPELSRALRSTLWTIRARAAPAGPRTRAASRPGRRRTAPGIRRVRRSRGVLDSLVSPGFPGDAGPQRVPGAGTGPQRLTGPVSPVTGPQHVTGPQRALGRRPAPAPIGSSARGRARIACSARAAAPSRPWARPVPPMRRGGRRPADSRRPVSPPNRPPARSVPGTPRPARCPSRTIRRTPTRRTTRASPASCRRTARPPREGGDAAVAAAGPGAAP